MEVTTRKAEKQDDEGVPDHTSDDEAPPSRLQLKTEIDSLVHEYSEGISLALIQNLLNQ